MLQAEEYKDGIYFAMVKLDNAKKSNYTSCITDCGTSDCSNHDLGNCIKLPNSVFSHSKEILLLGCRYGIL